MEKDPRTYLVKFEKSYRLLLSIKSLYKKDTAPMRRATYSQLLMHSRNAWIINLYEALPGTLKRIIIFIYSVKFLGEIINFSCIECDEISVWERVPERKYIGVIPSCGVRKEVNPKFRLDRFFLSCSKLKIIDLKKYWSVLKLLVNRYDLLSTLRSAEVICKSYFYSLCDLSVDRVFVSSDASPLSLSLLVGLKEKTKICHIPHGIVPKTEHLIYFDENYYTTKYNLEGLGNFCTGKNIYIGNVEKPLFNMQRELIVGIVISIIPSYSGICKVIQILNKLGISPLIKLHPNVIGRTSWKGEYSIVEHLDDCTMVICGNSGHSIKMLQRGTYVAYEPTLDNAPYDVYELVKRDLLIPFQKERGVDLAYYDNFYNTESWQERWSKI